MSKLYTFLLLSDSELTIKSNPVFIGADGNPFEACIIGHDGKTASELIAKTNANVTAFVNSQFASAPVVVENSEVVVPTEEVEADPTV